MKFIDVFKVFCFQLFTNVNVLNCSKGKEMRYLIYSQPCESEYDLHIDSLMLNNEKPTLWANRIRFGKSELIILMALVVTCNFSELLLLQEQNPLHIFHSAHKGIECIKINAFERIHWWGFGKVTTGALTTLRQAFFFYLITSVGLK